MAESEMPPLVHQIRYGTNEDGSIVEFRFIRENDTISYVQFPAYGLGNLYVAVQDAAAMATHHQSQLSKGINPKLITPLSAMQVTALQGAVDSQQNPVLSIEVNGKIRLDLSLDGRKCGN
jgi:hypothetical protein